MGERRPSSVTMQRLTLFAIRVSGPGSCGSRGVDCCREGGLIGRCAGMQL